MTEESDKPSAHVESTGGEVSTPAVDPKKTHVTHQWKCESPLISCRFDPSGEFAFSGCEDNRIRRWDLATGETVSFHAHDSWVRSLEFLVGENQMISAGFDGRLIWWSTAGDSAPPIRKIHAHDGWIRSISRDPTNTVLASGGNDCLVKLWDVNDASEIGRLDGHQKHVYSVLFHQDGKHLLSGDLAGNVIQWELESGKQVGGFDAKDLHSYNRGQRVDFGGVRALALSPDGKYLACGGLHKATNPLGAVHEPLVMLFDYNSGELVRSYGADKIRGVVWRVVFLDEKLLMAVSGGAAGGFVFFWQVDSDDEFHRFKLPQLARDLDLHPDGRQLVTAHSDKQLRISSMTESV